MKEEGFLENIQSPSTLLIKDTCLKAQKKHKAFLLNKNERLAAHNSVANRIKGKRG